MEGISRYITLGKYERDNNPTNGKEDLEWIVLGVKDGKALLTTRYVIDYMPLDGTWTINEIDSMFGPQWPKGDGTYAVHTGSVSWETSSLRAYLNGEFLKNAFSGSERDLILDYETEDGITDKVFILSKEELTEWIPYTKRSSALTSYAREKEDYEIRDDYPSPKEYYVDNGVLLRPHGIVDPVEQNGMKGYSYSDGGHVFGALSGEYLGIRPCIWVALDDVPES